MISWLLAGIADFRAAIDKRNVWLALAIEDIGDQHRHTYLGPLWLLINYLAFTGTFVIIFGRSFPIPNFAIYVAVGLFVWLYISEVITLSISLFAREEGFIKGTTLPLAVYVMRLTMQSLIRAGYAASGCVVIVLFAGNPIEAVWLWSLVALLLIFAVTPAAITLLAVAGAYFPDLQFVVANVMRVGMFLTPIFWIGDNSGGMRQAIYQWNPFTYFLEIVRAPVYAGAIPLDAYAVALPICIVTWIAALMSLGFSRHRLVFVL
ncbi:MAG: ABC transporter permease [Rhizobiaceae bacterium]